MEFKGAIEGIVTLYPAEFLHRTVCTFILLAVHDTQFNERCFDP